MALSTFIENINQKYGYAPGNRYRVMIAGNITAFDTSTIDMIQLYCETMPVPVRNIETSPVRIEHAFYEMPYGISYEPITLNFYMDREYKVREFFIDWQKSIYDPSSNGIAFRDGVTASIDLIPMDKKETDRYMVSLENAYPKTVGDIQYTASNQGDAIIMPVTFVYEKLTERVV